MTYLIILLAAILYCQESVGSWNNYFSHHHIKSCQYSSNDDIYCLTNGGISKFDFDDQFNEFITVNNGLSKDSYEYFHIDFQDQIWIQSGNDNSMIQIYNINEQKINNEFSFENSKIFKMDSNESNVIAIYIEDNQYGLLHFKYLDGDWNYKDFYNNINESINSIYDIRIDSNQIYVSTNTGIYTGDFSDNLKLSSNWENIDTNNEQLYFTKGVGLSWYTSNKIFNYSDSFLNGIEYNNISEIIDYIDLEYQIFINENSFYIYQHNNEIFSYKNEFSSDFVDIHYLNKKIYISIQNHGLLEFDIDNLIFERFFPIKSTMLNSQFSAITVLKNNHFIGIGSKGISYFDGVIWKNYIPNSIGLFYDHYSNNNFTLDYRLSNGGDGSIFPSWSIVESDENTIMFGNTQIRPDSPGYAGALVEFNLENLNLSVYDTTNKILDGLDGIYNSDWTNRNLIVNQIKKDLDGNIWVLNPYAESDSNIIAIKPHNSNNWVHIKHPNQGTYFMPTELDFDSMGRAWVGFENRTSLENVQYSSGGIKILLIVGEIGEDFDYYWRDITNPEVLPDMNVWSVTIDKQDYVWLLTSGGVQGYSTQNFTLNPIYLYDFYNYLPFYRGDHIRVDNQDNKWITTRHSGVKVILENTQYWPDAEGFTSENSGLLSDVVYDIAFDEENGFIWFATNLGVSKYRHLPSRNYTNKQKLLFHPNPFVIKESNEVIIEGCYPYSTVVINDVNGNHIKTLNSNFMNEASSQIIWNGKDRNGNDVSTGIYLISSLDHNGSLKRGKLAIIKK